MSHYTEQREADEIWEKYPDGATHYGGGTYWRQAGFYWMKYQKGDFHRVAGSDNPFGFRDYSARPQTHTKPDWSKAPTWATHYADGSFVQRTSEFDNQFLRCTGQEGVWNAKLIGNIECYPDYQERPKPHQSAQEPTNKYVREIIGLDGKTCLVDVYRVLEAFEVDSHAIAHSIKKLLAPGKRHAKTREQDLKEAIASIEAELLLMSQR